MSIAPLKAPPPCKRCSKYLANITALKSPTTSSRLQLCALNNQFGWHARKYDSRTSAQTDLTELHHLPQAAISIQPDPSAIDQEMVTFLPATSDVEDVHRPSRGRGEESKGIPP